ncbi:GNAT family N-acetyltransferase [Rhizobium sp. AQ_MP]|uniref:GNAT family N-acetyltransferase n=1 Tax=Rhizobium sp. AQ_MP TaxID=2761536 RepID=UPI001639A210|nr:GNAT family N-acetyltransferase [Rhizobium sp. AQ_MP]MBC2773647.1 GNAT family N-acetyltransferase [Rhizobium sp. AQ_MP]
MVTIRKARQDDAEILTEIGMRAWRKAMASVGEAADMAANAREAFARFAEEGWITITVVEKSGVPVGWAAREDMDETITDFWIDPDFEGQGFGTALLAALEDELKAQGIALARLQTHAMNTDALTFFKKKGYSVNWLTVTYNPKLDRDVQSVGLSKSLSDASATGYGQEF